MVAFFLLRKPMRRFSSFPRTLYSFTSSSSSSCHHSIQKILIANRGEIACRVMRSAHKLGLETVAVFSEADKHSLHVRMADHAICVGPPPAQLSYLNSSAIVEAALRTGANAIHPGYGFLSENAQFAQLCQENGILYIGPPVFAIQAMGDKSASKRLMSEAGVPVVPGYHGDEQNSSFLKSEAERIGYPILIKPTHGGGGKGMKIVSHPEDFLECLTSAQREATAAFGNSQVLVEKYISRPRHIEVQVFGDMHGNVIHLFERDCSLQRRHQKIIEEAPAPNITEEFRLQIGQAAVNAAKAVGYYNAGTVEFIVDTISEDFYFMEMNTRLQVEHPVTEMVTQQDLVEWQIRVANGECLPAQQSQICLSGHAFEARIYAENVEKGFLPAAGVLHHFHTPATLPGVRVETGVEEGDVVPVHYDPMIAKLITWGHNRSAALVKLIESLSRFQVGGVPTNIGFLKELARHKAFAKGEVETHFIEHHKDELFASLYVHQRDDEQSTTAGRSQLEKDMLYSASLVSACICIKDDLGKQQSSQRDDDISSISQLWRITPGFRINHPYRRNIHLQWKEELQIDIIVTYCLDGRYAIEVLGKKFPIMMVRNQRIFYGSHGFKLDIDGISTLVSISEYEKDFVNHIDVWQNNYHHHFTFPCQSFITYDPFEEHPASKQQSEKILSSLSGAVLSPMAGCIIKVIVQDGAWVKKGDPILVMEAMKMEHVVRAPADGFVQGAKLEVGKQVKDNSVLFSIVP